jgi:hypothetical protein
MDRLAVARILRKIGRLLEVQGASPVKARAYEREARARWAGDLERVIAEDRLTQILAIGKAPGCHHPRDPSHRSQRAALAAPWPAPAGRAGAGFRGILEPLHTP